MNWKMHALSMLIQVVLLIYILIQVLNQFKQLLILNEPFKNAKKIHSLVKEIIPKIKISRCIIIRMTLFKNGKFKSEGYFPCIHCQRVDAKEKKNMDI